MSLGIYFGGGLYIWYMGCLSNQLMASAADTFANLNSFIGTCLADLKYPLVE